MVKILVYYLNLLVPESLEIWITQDGIYKKSPMNRWIAVHWPSNLLKLALNCNCLFCIIAYNTVADKTYVKNPKNKLRTKKLEQIKIIRVYICIELFLTKLHLTKIMS
jgi:hypothetical protein